MEAPTQLLLNETTNCGCVSSKPSIFLHPATRDEASPDPPAGLTYTSSRLDRFYFLTGGSSFEYFLISVFISSQNNRINSFYS